MPAGAPDPRAGPPAAPTGPGVRVRRSGPRRSGVLLHLTSLPGPHGSGDLGPDALRFVDWLAAGGQSLWQFLPLGEVGIGHSPYMSASAFAGNSLLVDLGELVERGWLRADEVADWPGGSRVDLDAVAPWRRRLLALAASRFDGRDDAGFEAFVAEQADWLEDHALFATLSARWPGRVWHDWDPPLARRDPAALHAVRREAAEELHLHRFTQWCFFRQWQRLRRHARDRDVCLVGDLPFYVALHSADVWAHPELFDLDAGGRPVAVAGVPPDAFAATGQLWGNPLYRWSAHAAEGWDWWIRRLRAILATVDRVRIDHFRGFESCWRVPADAATAVGGAWTASPGRELFEAARAALGELPVIAEDLGVITPEVTALRRALGFPGMRVLQFGWGEGPDNDRHHLPHRYDRDCAVYGGTHDNDTALGWWAGASEAQRLHVRDYLACDGADVGWSFIRAACASVATLAVHPMQDVLRLGGEHRMNRPGTAHGNWAWRFAWDQVEPGHAGLLARMADLYGRAPRAGSRDAPAC